MKKQETPTTTNTSDYKGLPALLHAVRWTQHLLAILAEVLILFAFAMSGMDANLGGIMTAIPWLKWLWAAMFALGVDSAFVLSWVRVRQCAVNQKWGGLVWNILLALGLSLIVFQPVAVQMLQQSLGISFTAALAMLGINFTILVYARALVAVILGAVLALSNVETAMSDSSQSVATHPRRRVAIFDKVLDHIAPVVDGPSAPNSTNSELFSQQAVLENEQKEDTPVDTEQDIESGYSDEAGAPKRDTIEAAISRVVASGKKPNLAAISRELQVSYPYVKKVWAEMKQERTTDGMPALHVVGKE